MLNKRFLYMLIGVVVLITIPIFLNMVVFDTKPDSSNEPSTDESNEDGSDSNDGKQIYWGVDSASSVNNDLKQCVEDNFGKPDVWGRYLGDNKGVSKGLDADEVTFLHKNDIRILLIYNHFRDATGYDHGAREAKQAISLANDLDVPDGVAIFGDIEPKYPVDSAFIQGWYDTLAASDYQPGLYGVFDDGSNLVEAYHATKRKVRENTIVWTSYPQQEITTKENAPKYAPEGPDDALLYGWQYAIESDKCNIDTNLFTKELLDALW
ncbi:DUF1906 domain-containing protein [Virgibacillus dakarensis]|nr:DUF1906 domain-containing protein [Virgibacillus dakarensis]